VALRVGPFQLYHASGPKIAQAFSSVLNFSRRKRRFPVAGLNEKTAKTVSPKNRLAVDGGRCCLMTLLRVASESGSPGDSKDPQRTA